MFEQRVSAEDSVVMNTQKDEGSTRWVWLWVVVSAGCDPASWIRRRSEDSFDDSDDCDDAFDSISYCWEIW